MDAITLSNLTLQNHAIKARMYAQTVTTTLAQTDATVIRFDTIDYDPSGCLSLDPTNGFTAPVNGIYLFCAHTAYNCGGTSGTHFSNFGMSGSSATVFRHDIHRATNIGALTLGEHGIIVQRLVPGDFVNFQVAQFLGTTPTTYTGSQYTWFEAYMLRQL
jgi:hypothetical protein